MKIQITMKDPDALYVAVRDAVRSELKAIEALTDDDIFDDEVPIEWLADFFKLAYSCENLIFQLLTKRPENWQSRIDEVCKLWACDGGYRETVESRVYHDMLCPWRNGNPPSNVWIGTTVENQEYADKRIPELLKIPAKVRFLSCEPLLGAVDLTFPGGGQSDTPYSLRGNFWEVACENHCAFKGREDDLIPDPDQSYRHAERNGTTYVCPECHCASALVYRDDNDPQIHWVICGGESGPGKRKMELEWARSLRDQCQTAKVAFFVKQIDKVQPIPDDLMIRQLPEQS